MKTFALLALFVAAAYALETVTPAIQPPFGIEVEPDIIIDETKRDKRQIDDPKTEVLPVDEPVIIVKRDTEGPVEDSEVEPDVTIEILDGPAKPEERPKRDAEPVNPIDETKPVEETIATEVRPKRETGCPASEVKPDLTIEILDGKPVDETADENREKRHIEDIDEETKPVDETVAVEERPKRDIDNDDNNDDTDDVNDDDDATPEIDPRLKRQSDVFPEPSVVVIDNEGNEVLENPQFPDTEDSDLENPQVVIRQKRDVEGQKNETRTKRFSDDHLHEHAYPDCSCTHKYPHLPLYTQLHRHCQYPGKPHHPHPHPPCSSCGHNHGPKAPCHGHGHGHGSVYHHHHVHVVPHHVAPVHHVHHDVHHHFVPKKPHYRKPCDRPHHHFDHDEYKH